MWGTQFGVLGLFLESIYAAVFVHINDPKARRFSRINLNGRQSYVSATVLMLLHHQPVIHFVDVVAGEDKDMLRLLRADGINVLVNRIRRALIPGFTYTFHWRQHFDKLAHFASEKS